MRQPRRLLFNTLLPVALCLFVVGEVNYPQLAPESQLALFALFGLILCFQCFPLRLGAWPDWTGRLVDWTLILSSILCCGYVLIQSQPLFRSLWIGSQSLGNRAGQEQSLDFLVGAIGLIVVLEATRRSIGWTLPILAFSFLVYARMGPELPQWLFPHRGYPLSRIVAQTFLHSQGVFGIALNVMFTYVFLFVLFGSFLEAVGATQFIIDFARRVFRNSPGGPAKIAVLSSGLMGSLSGSAVANTATTGTFTIPMMRSSGFNAETASGIEAAASSGGALAPPVMGAAAYMMLEIINPPVTYFQIIRSAVVPAILYYLSLLLIVHFYSRKIGARGGAPSSEQLPVQAFDGFVFLGSLASLVLFLMLGLTPFRAVTLTLVGILLIGLIHPRRPWKGNAVIGAMVKSARASIPLVAAAACVGIIIGVVTLTGIGTKLPAMILPLAQNNLMAALGLLMVSSLVLGMGLPSAVCYLLLATLVGPALGHLGVVPMAAHFFIFYFGMMSMVTPPVALAAYTAATIAGASIMKSSVAAFRFSLVGFTLPYMFVIRPQLLLLNPAGEAIGISAALVPISVAVLGIMALAAGIAGFFFTRLPVWRRLFFLLAAALLLFPSHDALFAAWGISAVDLTGAAVLAITIGLEWYLERRDQQESALHRT